MEVQCHGTPAILMNRLDSIFCSLKFMYWLLVDLDCVHMLLVSKLI